MKKTLITISTISSLIIGSIAFADNANSGYYSTVLSKAKTTAAAKTSAAIGKALYTPPTDITVINSTPSLIHVMVPASPIYDDVVYAGGSDHIRHDSKYDDTHLVIKDPYYNAFFDQYVCRHAIVAVMGGPGGYRVTVDNEYCY